MPDTQYVLHKWQGYFSNNVKRLFSKKSLGKCLGSFKKEPLFSGTFLLGGGMVGAEALLLTFGPSVSKKGSVSRR